MSDRFPCAPSVRALEQELEHDQTQNTRDDPPAIRLCRADTGERAQRCHGEAGCQSRGPSSSLVSSEGSVSNPAVQADRAAPLDSVVPPPPCSTSEGSTRGLPAPTSTAATAQCRGRTVAANASAAASGGAVTSAAPQQSQVQPVSTVSPSRRERHQQSTHPPATSGETALPASQIPVNNMPGTPSMTAPTHCLFCLISPCQAPQGSAPLDLGSRSHPIHSWP